MTDRLFLLLSTFLLVLSRLPVIRFNRELNPDESQMISHAITLWQDPVYWRSVDGTTIGPLDNYLLLLPRLAGFQLDYSSTRVVGLMCIIVSFLFFFAAVRTWFGPVVARVASLFPLLFLSFTREVDFLHYSSEQLPLALLAMAVWLFSRLSTQSIRPFTGLFWFGVTAGMLPFAKLQSVPQALVLVVACGVMIWTSAHSLRERFFRSAVLIAGGIAFPLLVLACTIVFGVTGDLYDFYILTNLVYAGDREANPLAIAAVFIELLRKSPDFLFYLLTAGVLISGGLFMNKKVDREKKGWLVTGTLVIYLLVGVYSVTKTGHLFTHYLNFCIYPVGLLVACFGRRVFQAYGLSRFGVLLLLGWFAGSEAYSLSKRGYLNQYPSVGATALHQSETVKKITEYRRSGDMMAVWGWQCSYYVEAQLPQATAENHTERSIYPNPMKQAHRLRYMKDMQRNRPAFFVDAVGKNSQWLQDTLTQSYRSFPELADFVSENYERVDVSDGNKLFVRKDRLR